MDGQRPDRRRPTAEPGEPAKTAPPADVTAESGTASSTDPAPSGHRWETATLGGGCFWCLEPIFAELEGVVRVEPGYAGGHVPNPTYEQVCTGATGHAEVVQITFDPEVISYRDLLEVFFAIHDPTTPNRQGHDVGPQYRSIILYHSPEQKAVAEATIRELEASGRWKDPIVTEVVPFTAFYPAEEYHRRFYWKNPDYPYCRVVIDPKVRKFRQRFAGRLKPVTS
ncbi:MAG: peptide-methionine (S)-S-oxide reductase [Bacillota bacterium]|nr:MAG: peptide-methionine (S)-S-oxide reductase [Bacillota bacterium]